MKDPTLLTAPAVVKPWYREPLAWLVALFPAAAVVAGLVTAYIAVQSWDGLVVDDYYKRGLEINQTLARDERAHALGIVADVEVGDTVSVRLRGGAAFVAPARLTASFIHATRAGHDLRFQLARGEGDTYVGELPPLARGHWQIQLEADDWRVVQTYRR